jgi:hypothetical protein
MRAKLIAVLLLLAVPGAMPSAALAMNAANPATLVHAHAKMLQHACCPQLAGTQPAPIAPRPDEHRCCFLRGPSLPTSVASKEQLILAGHAPAGLVVSSSDSSGRSLLASRNSMPAPPLSQQMSVVLRN